MFSTPGNLRDQGEEGAPEVLQQESQAIQYREVDTIFGASSIEDTTLRERAIYIKEARRRKYTTVLTGPPLVSSRPISFSNSDALAVLFLHNDALIVTMLIDNCQVSKVLVDRGSSVNIFTEAPLTGWRTLQKLPERGLTLKPNLIYMGLTGTSRALQTVFHSQFARIPTTSSQSFTWRTWHPSTTRSSGDPGSI